MTQQFVAELHKVPVPALQVQMEPSSRAGWPVHDGSSGALPGPSKDDQAKREAPSFRLALSHPAAKTQITRMAKKLAANPFMAASWLNMLNPRQWTVVP